MKNDGLSEYRSKRNFSRTPEPDESAKKSFQGLIFVIQQHAASHMHYDFRLEIDGVLVSWAVPKGPSTDPKERRLAVRTEDHPLEYADFEGRIPKDEYGGGTVLLWDRGEYENLSNKGGKDLSPSEALEAGHLKFRLFGKKLRGGYALVHTRMRGDERNWLLIKEKDDEADASRNPVKNEPKSVLSGKRIEEMRGE